jgi:hypothetical protein
MSPWPLLPTLEFLDWRRAERVYGPQANDIEAAVTCHLGRRLADAPQPALQPVGRAARSALPACGKRHILAVTNGVTWTKPTRSIEIANRLEEAV